MPVITIFYSRSVHRAQFVCFYSTANLNTTADFGLLDCCESIETIIICKSKKIYDMQHECPGVKNTIKAKENWLTLIQYGSGLVQCKQSRGLRQETK